MNIECCRTELAHWPTVYFVCFTLSPRSALFRSDSNPAGVQFRAFAEEDPRSTAENFQGMITWQDVLQPNFLGLAFWRSQSLKLVIIFSDLQ